MRYDIKKRVVSLRTIDNSTIASKKRATFVVLTRTPTPTPTNTPTVTPTNTSTPTNTPTNTSTPSVTPTNTPTSSVTPTIPPIPSNTPTNTPTSTNTPTPTPTPTPTNALTAPGPLVTTLNDGVNTYVEDTSQKASVTLANPNYAVYLYDNWNSLSILPINTFVYVNGNPAASIDHTDDRVGQVFGFSITGSVPQAFGTLTNNGSVYLTI